MGAFLGVSALARPPHGQEFFAPFLANLTRSEVVIGGKRLDDGLARRAHPLDPTAMRPPDQPPRFAVPFRARHAEIVLDAAFGVGALLMADDHHRAARQPADAANNGLVLGERAIARKRLES